MTPQNESLRGQKLTSSHMKLVGPLVGGGTTDPMHTPFLHEISSMIFNGGTQPHDAFGGLLGASNSASLGVEVLTEIDHFSCL